MAVLGGWNESGRHSRTFLSAAAALVFAATADAQDLPASVTGPYVEYERAVEAGDGAAAYDAARRAFEAGQAERIDRETLGLLAENFGSMAAANRDFEQARDAWREAARLGDRARLSPTERAWRWHNAAVNAFLAEDTRDAHRCSRETVEALADLERIEGDALLFAEEAYALNARMALSTGQARRALEPAQALIALRVASGEVPDATLANAHYIAGISRLVRSDNVEAAYHFHMARDIARDQDTDTEELETLVYNASALRALAAGRAGHRASQVDDHLERDPLHQSRYMPEVDDEEPDLPPGRVDAEPIERAEPRYPRSAEEDGMEGVVIVEFAVDENGRVADPQIRASIPGGLFDEAVLSAMEDWTYTPATQEGVPVRREGVSVCFTFMLR